MEGARVQNSDAFTPMIFESVPDRRTDGLMDKQTCKAVYKDAETHLKTGSKREGRKTAKVTSVTCNPRIHINFFWEDHFNFTKSILADKSRNLEVNVT